MRAAHTRYEVPGWGVGELWTRDGVVLAHELSFDPDAGFDAAAVAASRASPGEAPAADAAERALVAGPVVAGPVVAVPVAARPPKGAASPPTGTVAAISARVGHGSAPNSHQSYDPRPTDEAVDPGRTVELVTAFLAGEDVRFDGIPVDLSWTTPFQHAVAVTLRAIPRGEVVSYGELAALASYPGAARAVGTFCARNRLMLLVPCHRVVGAAGLGGYGSAGVGVKRRLLALEGVHL